MTPRSAVFFASTMLLVSACTGNDTDPSSAGPNPSIGSTSTAPDPVVTTIGISNGSTTSTMLEQSTTGEQRSLISSCVTGFWMSTGYGSSALDRTLDNCEEADAALGREPNDDGSITSAFLLASVIGTSRFYEATLAIQGEYFPENDAIVTDDTKRAIAACTIAIGDPLTLHGGDFGDTFDIGAVEAAIAACGPALNATRIDASLDGDGVSIAKLVDLDVAAINAILTDPMVEQPVAFDPTVLKFDIPLDARVERLTELLPLL